MMGSGKTSALGHLVSKKLNLKFFDIDNLIEQSEGMDYFDLFLLRKRRG